LNFSAFIAPLVAGRLEWSVIECAFDGDPYVFAPSSKVVHVRSGSVLWQKERLLNVLIQRLPDRCTKVAWVDADILFTNREWAAQTSALLDEYPLVQPYTDVVRLPRGAT